MLKQSYFLIITFTFTAALVFGQSGTLDASFGNNGIVITDFNNRNDNLYSMEILPDQKIIAIGETDSPGGIGAFLACRYNTDGSLDIDFGENGFFNVILSGDVFCRASALQPDGRIILAGTIYHTNDSTLLEEEDFVLIRLKENGILDSTFGVYGIVTTNLAGNSYERLKEVFLQNDGKILAAGDGFNDQVGAFYGMVRYESSGQLDTTFGNKGIQVIWEQFIVQTLKLQTDGKILLGGYGGFGPSDDFELRRFEQDGQLDNSFGQGGGVHTDLSGQSDYVDGIIVEPDGKIFVSGGANLTGGTTDLAFARYNKDGSLDKSYGNNGFEIISLGPLSNVFDMVRQRDGKYVLCGKSNHLDGLMHFLLIRINHDGGLDTTFGNKGVVFTDLDGATELARALVIQDDNSIVLGGASQAPNLNFDFSLARYIVDDVVTSKDYNYKTLSFLISPNPCKEFISFNVDGSTDAYHCIVYDMSGCVVMDEIFHTNTESKLKVDTNLLINGYYTILLEIKSMKGLASFVVEK